MATYLALTTTNFQQNGYNEIARGNNKKDVENAALDTITGSDVYAETKRTNLIVISKSAAKRDYGIDIDSNSYIEKMACA